MTERKKYSSFHLGVDNSSQIKLVERSKRLIKQATACSYEEASTAFEASGRRPKLAIVMILLGVDAETARSLESQSSGPISEMIRLYHSKQSAENDT